MTDRSLAEQTTDPIPVVQPLHEQAVPRTVFRPRRQGPFAYAPRWLIWCFGIGIALVVVLALTDLGLLITRQTASPSPPGPQVTSRHTAASGPATSAGPSGSSQPKGTAASHKKKRTPPPSSAGAPRLAAVTPASARPGATVVVHGTNLFSPNGVVLARVDGQATRTDCPSRTSCDVTIPRLGGHKATAAITVTTALGTSNTVYLHYL